MKSGHHADVEAAELRSLLAGRHVHAGHFRQVLVSGAGPLGPEVADGHDLKGDQEQYAAKESHLVPVWYAAVNVSTRAIELQTRSSRTSSTAATSGAANT